MKTVAATLAASVAVVALTTASATAATPPAHKCAAKYSYDGSIRVTKTRSSCASAAIMLSDFTSRRYKRMFNTPGQHRFRMPRHGTDYKNGEDWRCMMRVRNLIGPPGTQPALRASGTCV